jgi:tetratricopeptide (TPR) repeat protein
MANLRILIILLVGIPAVVTYVNFQKGQRADCNNIDKKSNAAACAWVASGWFTPTRFRGSANYNAGLSHYHAGRYQQAITALDLSIEQGLKVNDERIAENYYLRGLSNARLDRHQDAIDDYTTAIEINSDYHAAYFARANQYKNQRKYELAVADNREALRIKPDDADTHYNLGSMLDALDRRDEAMAAFSRAIELAPKDPDGYQRRGYLYYSGDTQNLDKALADVDRAIALGKRDTMLFWYRASVRSQRNDHKGAIADLDQSITLDPTNQRSYYDRAYANRALGNATAAARDVTMANSLPGHWRLTE